MTPEGRMHGLFLGIDCGTQGRAPAPRRNPPA
ncbi:hypothetical protein T6L40_27545, partial [Pseudomonas aeruginosa]|nr:hypothetical protein [Pseudomonas aeruginosa]